MSDRVVDLWHTSTWKCSSKRAKLIDNAAESKQVDPGVVRLAIPYFWSDVAEGSSGLFRLNVGFRPEVPGETRVADLDLVAEQENFLGLEVVVDNLSTLQIVECR
jgi:hypothetical protein